jgi:hypothetical protein
LESRRAEQVLPGGVDTNGTGEEVGKVCRRVNMVQILCTHVCKQKNETRNRGRGIKETSGGGEFKYVYLTYYKNFCKYHSVPSPRFFKKEEKNKVKKQTKKKTTHLPHGVSADKLFVHCLILQKIQRVLHPH